MQLQELVINIWSKNVVQIFKNIVEVIVHFEVRVKGPW